MTVTNVIDPCLVCTRRAISSNQSINQSINLLVEPGTKKQR